MRPGHPALYGLQRQSVSICVTRSVRPAEAMGDQSALRHHGWSEEYVHGTLLVRDGHEHKSGWRQQPDRFGKLFDQLRQHYPGRGYATVERPGDQRDAVRV